MGAGTYASAPWETSFFALTDSGGWRTPYGQFFMEWYSGMLVKHAEVARQGAGRPVLEEDRQSPAGCWTPCVGGGQIVPGRVLDALCWRRIDSPGRVLDALCWRRIDSPRQGARRGALPLSFVAAECSGEPCVLRARGRCGCLFLVF
jgi:Glycosyl hydrolase family 14